MGNLIEIVSKIIFLLISVVSLILIYNVIIVFIELINEKRFLEGIFLLLIGIPFLSILFICSIYVITHSGFLIIKKDKILYYGIYFMKIMIKKTEIDRIYITWESKSLGRYGYIYIINLHVYTLSRPQLYLKIDYWIKRNSIEKRLLKFGYKVTGAIC